MDQRDVSYLSKTPIIILDDQYLQILDANEKAIQFYGYSYKELCQMSLSDLGSKKEQANIIGNDDGVDRAIEGVWVHKKKDGTLLYVQFTHHLINYEGRPAKFAVVHDVSEEIKNKEDNSNQSPNFFDHNYNFPLAMVGYNSNFVISEWSEKAEELFGWTKEEVVRKKNVFETLLPEEEIKKVEEGIRIIVTNQVRMVTGKSHSITKDGKIKYCRSHSFLAYDEEGELISVHTLINDITDLKESETLFSPLSKELLVGAYLIQDGKFQYVNTYFANIFGYPKEEIQGNVGLADLAHPEDRLAVKKKFSDPLGSREGVIDYRVRCMTKNKTIINVHLYGSEIEYQGAPAVIGTLIDVSKDNRILERYQAIVKSFQDLFNSISDAIYIQDKHGRFLEVNEGAEKMYGYTKDEFLGKSPGFLAVDEKVGLQKSRKYVKKALNGKKQKFKWWGKRKNGEKFPKEIAMNRGRYLGEDVIIAAARDISDQYKAEGQLRHSKEKFRQLFQNAPIGIAFLDKEQRVEGLNQAFIDIFGYKTEDIKGEFIDEVIAPDESKVEAYKVSKKVFSGQTAQGSGRRKCKDGSIIDVLIYGVPVIVEEETIAIYGLYIDITERKKNEIQLKKSLREKDVLLSEVHHRVKNNLAVISGLLELQSFNTSSEEASKVLKNSQIRINSIALIHEKLYQKENLSKISFDSYLEELIDAIYSSLQTNQHEININIKADPVGLNVSQAIPCGLILNELITNTYKHAFGDHKTGNILVSFTQKEDMIMLIFEDDGRGMKENINTENPTSLGIQIINTLVLQLGGKAIFNDLNPGTQFKFSFAIEQ